MFALAGGCDSNSGDENTDDSGSQGVRVVWSTPTAGSYSNAVRPLIEGDRAFVHYDTLLTAFDLESGDRIWSVGLDIVGPLTHALVADESALYLVYSHWVKAFDKADGRVLWTAPEGSTIYLTTLAQNATHLFFGRQNEVVRIDKASGRVDLVLPIGDLTPPGIDHAAYDPCLSPDGATLFVPTGYFVPDTAATSGYLLAFDARTGERRWMFPVPQRRRTLPDGHVSTEDAAAYGCDAADGLVVTPPGQTIYALDAATGAVVWEHHYEQDAFDLGVTISSGAVYAPSMQENVHKYDLATGEVLWSRRTRGTLTTLLTVRDERVYFTSPFVGEAWVLDANDDRVVWTGKAPGTDEGFLSPLAVGDEYMVAIGTRNIYGMTKP